MEDKEIRQTNKGGTPKRREESGWVGYVIIGGFGVVSFLVCSHKKNQAGQSADTH